MKKVLLVLFLLLQCAAFSISAQVKPQDMLDSARYYYKKNDFKKSAHFYDVYFVELKQGENNNDDFCAALASCMAGNKQRASYYLRRSGEIGYDYTEYDNFVNNPLAGCLKELPEWNKYAATFKFKTDSILSSLKKITAMLTDTSKRVNRSYLTDSTYLNALYAKNNASSLITKIKNFNNYPALVAPEQWTLCQIKVNDTLTVPYLLYIPKQYNHLQQTALYVYLHGGVGNSSTFKNPAYVPPGAESIMLQWAKEQNAFILYPLGNKNFNWLIHQVAFETILKEIVEIKSLYNINDNKVYAGGHSDGARGAFWYAIKQPDTFSSFYCLNYFPSLYFGNTSLRNLKNERKLFSVSSTEDSLFPINMVTDIYKYAVEQGANWKNYTFKGAHNFSIFNRDSIKFIFDSLAVSSRNPFPKKIEWETDDIKNGRSAWVAITNLDTLSDKATWQKELNPTIMKDGKEAKYNFNRKKSGAVIAAAKGNTIRIQSSCVKEISLFISPDMFDLKKKIIVYVNDVLLFDKRVKADKDIVFNEFLKTKDRSFITAAIIDLVIH